MKGAMIVYETDGNMTVRPLTAAPDLDTLQKAVGGGSIEVIPFWNDIDLGDKRFACVAFCNEEGKVSNPPLPFNRRATQLWEKSLKRKELTLDNPAGGRDDYLVGPICVIYGDNALLESL